jgi:hypothetical protein
MSDWKFGHEGANAKEPSAAYLASVGLDPASEALAKAKSAIAAFADAVTALDDIAKRIAALEAEPPEVDRETRIAKLNGGAQ